MARIYNPNWSLERRKQLRNNATRTEQALWMFLRKSQIGRKFRRQAGIGPYIVDFYCPKLKLVIELDGPIHNLPENQEYDRVRTEYLNNLQIQVLRFTNDQIDADINIVLNAITRASSRPLLKRGGG